MLTDAISKQIFDVTTQRFVQSLQHRTPTGSFRDFQLWGISDKNPQRDIWVQILGIPQLTALTRKLLDGILTDDEWAQMSEYIAIMNAYLLHETVSDNIAIGMYYHNAHGDTADLRMQVIASFNDATISLLESANSDQTEQLLMSVQPHAERISRFQHSLTETEMRHFATLYRKMSATPHIAKDLEFNPLPSLWTNMYTCHDVAVWSTELACADLVKRGLVWRYASVNRQLRDLSNLTVADLVETGAHSILVMPVLAYYIGVIAEVIKPNEAFADVLADNSLETALYDAALLVRLLNDLGTGLLTQQTERALLHQQLLKQVSKPRTRTFIQALEAVAKQNVALTRLNKDIQHGEFNVVLAKMIDVTASKVAVEEFMQLLDQFATIYDTHYNRMLSLSAGLSERLGTDFASQLIIRFVKFHEKIYSQRFDTQDGDYATKPKQSLAATGD
ncbi:MAG: hypothetical protein AAFN11_03865 [Chloroflexota bacterium]